MNHHSVILFWYLILSGAIEELYRENDGNFDLATGISIAFLIG